MSTSSVGGSSSFFDGTLTTGASNSIDNPLGAQESISGLGSGLDTTAIINELMAVQEVPVNQLTLQQEGYQAQQSDLTTIQTNLQNVMNDAANLSDPALFTTSQTVSTSDPNLMTATTSTGAAVGSYEVNVTALASSAQRTFTYTAPTSNDTITIDGVPETITAGESSQSFASTINSDPNATVWAAALDSGTIVFSDRATGDNGSNYIQVSDPGGSLAQQTSLAVPGQNAEFTVNGGTQLTSTSNTVTNAIPGVSLTLQGLTSSGPVTVNVAAPAPSSSGIATAVNQFVTDYNNTVNAIETQLAQTPVNNPQDQSDESQGQLYDDSELTALLNNMRELMYTGGAGLPEGMASLADIGVSTGAPSGAAPTSSQTLSGDLTVDTSTLDSAVATDPDGVESVLSSFATSFQNLVNVDAGPGGTLSQRITDDSDQSADLGTQISNMEQSLTDYQTNLQAEYAQLASALEASQAQQSWLTQQIAGFSSSSSS